MVVVHNHVWFFALREGHAIAPCILMYSLPTMSRERGISSAP